MAYTNFTNCTATEYKNIIYNQETHNKIRILFNSVDYFNDDADEHCESFEVVSRVIPNGSKTFMLENLVSQEATLVLHNIDTSIIQDQVSISIGTLVSENTYEYVPIGIYNLQEIPTTDNGKTTIKLRDNSVKLDFNYNAKPLIDEHGGTATKLQILQDICTKAGITCNVSTFIGSSDLIGVYNNTITGRQYVAYLAGSAGAIPIITRTGALDFKYINNLSTIEIPIEIVERYTNAENFKISRVLYEDAIRKYESGNETYDTLFLDSANPYISSQEQVASIYNIVNNFEINSFTTGRILGNPAIDSYDLIQIIDYDGTIFKTFANNTLRYNGKMINTFASEISFERKKENVSLKSGATFKKWAKTEIDNANAQITIQAGQIEEIEQDLSSPTSTKEGKYFDIEDALDSPLIDFSLYGDTQQDSTTGKNLFNVDTSQKYGTGTGITITKNSDGSYTLNGTASGDIFYRELHYLNEQHTISYTSNNSNNGVFIRTRTGTPSAQTGIQDQLAVSSTSGKLTSTKQFDFVEITIARSTSLNNFKIYIQLEKGSIASDFEPYTNGPAPNPTFPMAIHNVSGDNTIEICGKNLFDLSKVEIGKSWNNSSNSARAVCYIKVEPSTKYTISYNNISTFDGVYNFEKVNKTDTTATSSVSQITATKTITTQATTQYLGLQFNKSSISTSDFIGLEIQIEKSESKTTYEAYTGYTQEINLGKNLFDKNNVIDDYYVSTSILANNSWCYFEINLNVGETYFTNVRTIISFFNGNTNISYQDINNTSFTVPQNTTKVYYSIQKTNKDTAQLEKGSQATSYSPYFTPIELNKIEKQDHTIIAQDYIYPSNDRWFLHKEINKIILNGSENWENNNNGMYYARILNDLIQERYSNGYTNFFVNKHSWSDLSNNKNTFVLTDFANDGNYNNIIVNTNYATLNDYKTFLGSNNLILYYPLSTPTDTEITSDNYPVLLEQLNRLMTLPLYNNITHITLTPNDLQPTMKIEYFRDTSLNNTFVPKTEMNKYYTKTETIAQIQISNSSIQQDVVEIQNTLDSNGEAINTISNQVQTLQTSTSLQINSINTQLENGVEKLTNSLVKIDANGINTSKTGETFNTQITNKTFEVKDGDNRLGFMGYDTEKKKTIVEFPELQTQRLTNAYHTTEKITEDGLLWSADYYIGGDN